MKYTYALSSNIAAVTISGLSVILFFVSTNNEPIYVRISGIGTNFFIGWLTGKDAIDYFKNKIGITRTIDLSKTSIISSSIRGLIVALTAIISSAPFSIATYYFSDGLFFKRIIISLIQFTGTLPLYCYSMAWLMEDDARRYHALLSTLFFRVSLIKYRWSNQELYQRNKDIFAIKMFILTKMDENIRTLKNQSIEEFNYSRIANENLTNQLLTIFQVNQSNPVSNRNTPLKIMWKYLDTTIDAFIYLIGGLLLTSVTIGYTCSTKNTLLNFRLNEVLSWLFANLFMFPLYYMAFKGGGNTSNEIYQLIKSIITFNFDKPISWKINKALGSIPMLIAIAGSILLASASGYTGKTLFIENCPVEWQFPYSNYFIAAGIAVFNAIYTYYALSTGYIGLHQIFDQQNIKDYIRCQKIFTQLLHELNSFSIDETIKFIESLVVQNQDNEKFLDSFFPNSHIQDALIRQGLFKRMTPIISDNTFIQSEIQTCHTKSLYGTFKPI